MIFIEIVQVHGTLLNDSMFIQNAPKNSVLMNVAAPAERHGGVVF